jgi:hypothetical protein
MDAGYRWDAGLPQFAVGISVSARQPIKEVARYREAG